MGEVPRGPTTAQGPGCPGVTRHHLHRHLHCLYLGPGAPTSSSHLSPPPPPPGQRPLPPPHRCPRGTTCCPGAPTAQPWRPASMCARLAMLSSAGRTGKEKLGTFVAALPDARPPPHPRHALRPTEGGNGGWRRADGAGRGGGLATNGPVPPTGPHFGHSTFRGAEYSRNM
eukprot:2273610-Pyramimonas_sp.AAC.1